MSKLSGFHNRKIVIAIYIYCLKEISCNYTLGIEMAAINFPNSPTINQVYISNGAYFTYDGVKWTASTNMTLVEEIATDKAIVMAIALG